MDMDKDKKKTIIPPLPPKPLHAPPANGAYFRVVLEGDEWVLVRSEPVAGFPNTLPTGIRAEEAAEAFVYGHRAEDGSIALVAVSYAGAPYATIPLDPNDPLVWFYREADILYGGSLAEVAARVEDLLGTAPVEGPGDADKAAAYLETLVDTQIYLLWEARRYGLDLDKAVRARLVAALRGDR